MISINRWYEKLKLKLKLYYMIFAYNHFNTTSSIVDNVFDPFYRLAEGVSNKAGPIFVTLVIILTTSVVTIFHVYIVPWNIRHWSTEWVIADVIIGYWLLINIVFNYYKGVTTRPGEPPHRVENPVSVCKNCISPKPPRTHHCSVCKRCVLKMDHHCPWLNNCVGHFNHRYFYLFCLYMCSGTIFVVVTVYGQFRHYFGGGTWNFAGSLATPLLAVFIAQTKDNETLAVESGTDPLLPVDLKERFWIIYEFFLCAGVILSLGSLVIWQTYLISRGETSIERHINHRETKRLLDLGAKYKNPYHFGLYQNWRIFFGIEEGTRRSWRHVLLPSSHKPTGDGLLWRTSISKSA